MIVLSKWSRCGSALDTVNRDEGSSAGSDTAMSCSRGEAEVCEG